MTLLLPDNRKKLVTVWAVSLSTRGRSYIVGRNIKKKKAESTKDL